MLDHIGVKDELRFWGQFVKTRQFETWLQEDRPTPELQPEIVQLIQAHRPQSVLDVGSGVVSVLRGTVPSQRITATDLLADHYREIFDYGAHQIMPPLAVAAEHLLFKEDFDVVFMRNALDHTKNPVEVWQRLKQAVKPGGLLIVAGFEKEATHHHGFGMHRWDVILDRDGLEVCAYGDPEMTRLDPFPFHPLDDICRVQVLTTGRRWISWAGRKGA